jgi:hypothetical protein
LRFTGFGAGDVNGALSDRSAFPAISQELLHTIDSAAGTLRSISPEIVERPIAPGKWSPKQIIGHLIDSAVNNHQRFVRAQLTAALEFPGYEQAQWVTCQGYQERAWADLVDFWLGCNRHLAFVIERIPETQRDVACRIGANAPVTLGFLAHDYVRHLKHHLAQLGV